MVRTTAVTGAVGPKGEAVFERQHQESDTLNEREDLAVSLAERIALDPHTDAFFESLKGYFTNEKINWGCKFNITMNLDSNPEFAYPTGMDYREEELA